MSSGIAFTQQVTQHLGFLDSRFGFDVIHEEYYPEHFGNALVVVQFSSCRIRIMREKGQVLVECGPLWAPEDWASEAPDLWFDLADLIGLITHGQCEWEYHFDCMSSDPATRIGLQLDHIANALQSYGNEIQNLFGSDTFEHKRSEISDYRQRRFQQRRESARDV